jgi:hypothetical protein
MLRHFAEDDTGFERKVYLLRAKCDTHLEIAPCAERTSRVRNYESSSNAEISALKKGYEGIGLGFGVLGFLDEGCCLKQSFQEQRGRKGESHHGSELRETRTM